MAPISGRSLCPRRWAACVDLGFRSYPTYRLFLIAVGLSLALVLWFIIERSLFGARLRAAVDNPRMARAGIDVDRLFTATFVMGCALAGFGGVVGAELLPLQRPFYALRYLVIFLSASSR